MSDPQPDQSPTSSSPAMRRQYLMVIIVWVLVLAALYAFQSYFS